MTKVNEPFKPEIKSEKLPEGISFSIAESKHIEEIFELMFLRNPGMDKVNLLNRIEREVLELNNGVDYGIYVALLEDKVVGFCRFFTSKNTPREKIKYPHPDGMFCMGTIVHPDYRRKGIARYLSDKRFEVLKSLGCNEVYSLVALDNPTSIKMHNNFNYEEIERGPGFFIVSFDCGEGILFKKSLN